MGEIIKMAQLSFIIALVLLHDYTTHAARGCADTLDVVFVVDGTNHSTNQNDFQHDMELLKTFLANVSHKLFAKAGDLRVAQVVFGREGQEQFAFTNTSTKVTSSINEMRHHDGPPDIRKGLRVARRLIQKQIWLRRDTQILLVTADTSYHEQEGEHYKGDPNKLPIIAVGYTNAVAKSVLRRVTGEKSNVLMATNSNALRYIIDKTVNKLLCRDMDSNHLSKRFTNGAPKCKDTLDVVLLVDVTLKSNKPDIEMKNLRNYLVAVSDYLFDRISDLRIAQVIFGQNARVRFTFSRIKTQVQDLISTMKYMDGTANIISGIRTAAHVLKTVSKGGRPASILLVTARTPQQRLKMGRNPPFRGMKRPTVVAVGYADFVYKDVLLGITGEDSNVILADNSGALLSLTNNTANRLACPNADTNTLPEFPVDMKIHHKHQLKDVVANKEVFQNVSHEAKEDPARFNAEVTTLVKVYDGPVEDYLEFDVFVEVLPKYRMANLTIADVDNKSADLFNTLPDTKKLALTRQTLEPLSYLEVHPEIEDNFRSKGCAFVGGINVSVLMQPGHVSLGLALDMCNCSEQKSQNIPAKMDVLCKIIFANTKSLQDFLDIQERLCALCFTYILTRRPTWQKVIVADQEMKNSACSKIGQSFLLPPSVLAQWALVCTDRSNHSVCYESRPSLMLHGPSLPSAADLAVCKDVFCHRLCHLTKAEVDVFRQTLKQQHSEDMGCLAYLDGVNPPINVNPHRTPSLNASSIAGSCPLKSRVIKRAKEAGRRKKRACSMTCEYITSDIQDGIVPPDVLDPHQLEICFDNDLYNCVQKNNLGDYHWDIEQAKAIFNRLRQDLTLKHFQNSTRYDTEVLGYIGLGFSPNELTAMDSLSDVGYDIFGATYGWSKEQLQRLASRYMQDINPQELEDIDLARLNHLVCGLQVDQVKEIRVEAIKNTTAILGRMQRCEIEILEVLAQRLILYYGPVVNWPEDHFSEFGIMLAGLNGEDLKAVGTTLVDHVTVPVVNHIPPREFWKLTPEQTSLFSYDVSLALSRRGLCAWLTDRHKKGYLEHLCSAGTDRSQGIAVLILAVIASYLKGWSS